MYPGPPPTVSCRGPTTDQPATDSQRTSQAEELQEHEQATGGSHHSDPGSDGAADEEGSSPPQHHESCAAPVSQSQGVDLGAAAATGVSSMLTVQYRMHSSIMQWSSDEMYKVCGCKGMASTTCLLRSGYFYTIHSHPPPCVEVYIRMGCMVIGCRTVNG